jgi:hypothetical protein
MGSKFRNPKYASIKPVYGGKVICAQQMTIGVYKVDVLSFANQLAKTAYLPKMQKYIYSKDCVPQNPTIGDTRTSYNCLEDFSKNIKQVFSILGELKGDLLIVTHVVQG